MNSDKLPQYCGHCGAGLVAGERRVHGDHFDSRTGQPTKDREYDLDCPKNRQLWRRVLSGFIVGSHDAYLIIERPEAIHAKVSIHRRVIL